MFAPFLDIRKRMSRNSCSDFPQVLHRFPKGFPHSMYIYIYIGGYIYIYICMYIYIYIWLQAHKDPCGHGNGANNADNTYNLYKGIYIYIDVPQVSHRFPRIFPHHIYIYILQSCYQKKRVNRRNVKQLNSITWKLPKYVI